MVGRVLAVGVLLVAMPSGAWAESRADISVAVGAEEVGSVDGYSSAGTGDALRAGIGWRFDQTRVALSLTRIEFDSGRRDLLPELSVNHEFGTRRLAPVVAARAGINRSNPYGVDLDVTVDQLSLGVSAGLRLRVNDRVDLRVDGSMSRRWELRTQGLVLLELAVVDLLYAPPQDERVFGLHAGLSISL